MKNIHIAERNHGQMFFVIQNGFAVGRVYNNGTVTNNNGLILSHCPYKGLAKLLNVDEAEVRKAWPEIYENRSQE